MPESKANSTQRKARVSRTEWLEAALEVLKDNGIEAVRVERLAARLGVAKSGFYYHFRDRNDLYQKMLDHWLALDASPLLKERLFKSATPEERLKITAEVVDDAQLSQFDAAIRQWARKDLKVRRIWRREMNKRLDHLRGIFALLGFEGDDLEMRVRTFVGYHVSEREIFGDLSKKERDALRDMRIRLLTRRD